MVNFLHSIYALNTSRLPLLRILSLLGVTAGVIFFVPDEFIIGGKETLIAAAILLTLSLAEALKWLNTGTVFGFAQGISIISFIVAYPLSAVVHLVRSDRIRLGFYHLTDYSSSELGLIWHSLFLIALAYIALRLGIYRNDPPQDEQPLSFNQSLPLLFILGVVFIAIGLWANVELFNISGMNLTALTVVDRSSVFEMGSARFYFMGRWLAWGIFFVLLYSLGCTTKYRSFVENTWLPIAIFIMLANSFWRGGRGEGAMSIMPILFVTARFNRVIHRKILLVITVSLIAYMALVTLARTGDNRTGLWLQVLDWQLGRFSMVGLSVRMVQRFGYDWGLSMLASLIDVFNAPFYLIMKISPIPALNKIVNFTGLYLLGDPNKTGIVPGSICELYFNFGFFGVLIGYFLLGKLISFIAYLIHTSNTVGTTMLSTYIIILICMNIIPGPAMEWIYRLVTIGLPFLVYWFIERLSIKIVFGQSNRSLAAKSS